MDDDRIPLDRVSIRNEVANERLRQSRRGPATVPLRSCADDCDQGRKVCPTPQACQRPEPTTQPRADGIQSGPFMWPLTIVLVLFVVWMLSEVAKNLQGWIR